MKKLIAITLVMLLAFTTVFANGSSESQATADSGKTYTIKLGHTMSTAHPRHVSLLEFEKYVEEKSGGKVQVELFPAGVLGSEPDMQESMRMGTLEAFVGGPFDTISKKLNLFLMPFFFDNQDALMRVAKNEEVFNKTVKLIDDFKNYFKSHNQTIYENPSPGNKAGGISSLEDKSLGCTQKSGTSTVNDVLMYGETVKEKGLNLLSAPGNDLVASSALAVSGCHMVLFTTGRGTPFASPVPTLKISSNSPLYNKKNNWIDFNAGDIANGAAISDKGEELFKLVIDVASGKEVKSEINSYHDLAIFKQGVTL